MASKAESRETKLVCREPAAAEAIAELIVGSDRLGGFTTKRRPVLAIRYTDTYYGPSPAQAMADSQQFTCRRREIAPRQVVWHLKQRTPGAGNDWTYTTDVKRAAGQSLPPGFGAGAALSPLLRVDVHRRGIGVPTPTGDISVSADFCTFFSAEGEQLGKAVEVEVKAAPACSDMAPLVDYLCATYGLVPARRSKLERGLDLLRGKRPERRKVILDMDPGVDDAIAILLALGSPELDVLAITTVAGNVGLEQTTRNARLVTDEARRLYGLKATPLIAKGLTPPGELPDASDVHGEDGLGGCAKGREPETPLCPEPAVDLIVRLLNENPGEVTLVSTGPLTNIAACAGRYPLALSQARELIAMGGVFFQAGNRSAAAEFNVHRDCRAAAEVVEFCRRRRAPGGPVTLPLTFVGLDVTHRVRLFLEDLKGKGKARDFVRRIAGTYMRFYEQNEGLCGCYLHDPLAVAFAIDRSLCDAEPFCVEVETEGRHTAGATIADSRPTRLFADTDKRVTGVCVSVDADRARAFILGRVLGDSAG